MWTYWSMRSDHPNIADFISSRKHIMIDESAYIEAMISLHRGLRRQGPGDPSLSLRILEELPALPVEPRIADLGCGAGDASILLAKHFRRPVRAVELAKPFLDDLKIFAAEAGVAELIEPIAADMGALNWEPGSVDLLWSEGAAYNLTFAGALQAWQPLLAPGGIAVISDATWLEPNPPTEIDAYWNEGYPHMGDEATNRQRAEDAGFTCLGIHRLSSEAWWSSYYQPLQERISALRAHADPAMQAVIAESEAEMDLFRRYSNAYGYAFYVLQA